MGRWNKVIDAVDTLRIADLQTEVIPARVRRETLDTSNIPPLC